MSRLKLEHLSVIKVLEVVDRLRLGLIDLKVRMDLLERKKLGIGGFVRREAKLLVVWTIIDTMEDEDEEDKDLQFL